MHGLVAKTPYVGLENSKVTAIYDEDSLRFRSHTVQQQQTVNLLPCHTNNYVLSHQEDPITLCSTVIYHSHIPILNRMRLAVSVQIKLYMIKPESIDQL